MKRIVIALLLLVASARAEEMVPVITGGETKLYPRSECFYAPDIFDTNKVCWTPQFVFPRFTQAEWTYLWQHPELSHSSIEQYMLELHPKPLDCIIYNTPEQNQKFCDRIWSLTKTSLNWKWLIAALVFLGLGFAVGKNFMGITLLIIGGIMLYISMSMTFLLLALVLGVGLACRK